MAAYKGIIDPARLPAIRASLRKTLPPLREKPPLKMDDKSVKNRAYQRAYRARHARQWVPKS